MPITVTVRTVSNNSATIDVEPTITIGELKKAITEQCGLGVASTLVYKGQPLKKDDVTLEDIKYQAGETLVGVFKKAAAAPAAAAAPQTTPVVAQTPAKPAAAAATTADVPNAPVKAAKPAAAPAPAAAPVAKPPSVEWSCPACTYVNIPARTICEMCGTEDPAKAKAKPAKAADQQARDDLVIPEEVIQEQLKKMGAEGMDEETKNIFRSMIEEDLRDAMMANGGKYDPNMMNDGANEIAIDIEDLLKKAEEDEEYKKGLFKEFNLPDDATMDQLRQAIVDTADIGEEDALDGPQLSQLLNDPTIGPQIQELLASGASPEDLQSALLQLLAGGIMIGEEDDEEVDYDESMGM